MDQHGQDPTVRDIDVQSAADRVREQDAVLLDVREDDEWAAGHAPGALHVPLGQLPARTAELDRDRPVLAICRSGNRSRTAAAQLTAAGLDVVNVAGGMKAWHAAGLPTTTDSGAPATIT